MDEPNALLSRIIIRVPGMLVWACFYANARCAYRLRRGMKKLVCQVPLAVLPVFIGVLQVFIMESLSPDDAYGSYFAGLIFVEAGGGLIVLFLTLLHERARSRAQAVAGDIGA